MLKHRNKNKGFTLIEIIATTTIIAMLAAFAVPTFIGYIETGNQTKRMNIAKTIYLAAQNQLTEKKINQTLGTFSMTEKEADAKIKDDATFIKPDELANGVLEKGSSILPSAMPPEEKANIVYLSKPQGVASGKVYDLLDSVIQDKSVLNNAILIEYNKTTGFVLSVFYSEETGGSDESQFAFTYAGSDNKSKTDKYKSISGTRPYTYADERRQGYCGIEETGMLPPTGKEVIINIKDGKKSPLSDGSGGSYKNVLYAEALVPKSMIASGQKIQLQILSQSGGTPIYETGEIESEKISDSFQVAKMTLMSPPSGHIVFKSLTAGDGTALETGFVRIVWVLDYVDGDMMTQTNSIGMKYLTGDTAQNGPQNIRVGISGNGINAKSLSMQNSHFAYETQDKSIVGSKKFKSFITSARHLNNVRYKLDGDFRQLYDIDMTKITNFLPIGSAITTKAALPAGKVAAPFEGKYFARKEAGTYSIKNLKIDTNAGKVPGYPVPDNTGLFGAIKGSEPLDWSKGVITGLTLENPRIKGGNYVGALAGLNSGQISMVTVENNKQLGPIVQGKDAIGGIVGENRGGLSNLVLVNKSEEKVSLIKGSGDKVGGIAGKNTEKINDIVVISSSSASVVSGGEVLDNNIGGIAGLNNGQIDRVMYLAVAPKFETTDGENIAPIQGASSTGIINDGVYLSGKAQRPAITNNEYNFGKANIGKPKSTEEISKVIDWKNWKKNKDSDENNMLAIYPYWYQYETPYKEKDKINNWPVVNEEGGKAELVYYELYSDNTWGYYNQDDTDNQTLTYDINKTVVNDGYLIEYPDNNNGVYTIEVGHGENKELELKSDSWKWNDKLLTQDTQNLEPVRFTKNGKSYMRLFLRNSILESVAKENNEIKIIVKKGNTIMSETTFNPLFAPKNTVEEAQKAESSGSFIIRSPRQLDNVDKANNVGVKSANVKFYQALNIDFGSYKEADILTEKQYTRELESVNYTNEEYKLNLNTKISTSESIVDFEKDKSKKLSFNGEYNGNNKYIRNVRVDGIGSSDHGRDIFKRGLFSEISGYVHNIALLESDFESQDNGNISVGGVTGSLLDGGHISHCELSNVTVKTTQNNASIGGVVGENNGTVENVYFNSTYRENGVYSTPVISNKSNTVGGLVGNNTKDGVLRNAYTTAIGPEIDTANKDGKINAIAGGENGKGTIKNVYYLAIGDYNSNINTGQGLAFNPDGSLVTDSTKKISTELSSNDNNVSWENATDLTTKETVNCKGLAYPYPKLAGINHYFDWPILVNTLKYFEEYSDGGFGYYFYNGGKIVDTLKYDNPDITVVDEGYIVEVLSLGNYDIKFNSLDQDKDNLTKIESKVFHDKIAIRLNHSQVEKLITGSNITNEGIKPVKIEAFKYTGDKVDETTDILLNNNKSAYFNPLFPKQVYYYADNENNENVQYVKTLEIRSPRQMLNVEPVSNNMKKISIENLGHATEEKGGGSKIYLKNIYTKFPYGNLV
ncbi:MAG: prepilin-type N-terminal cleavage/methylation domain-containing protein, partial [Proteocatella sp.]